MKTLNSALLSAALLIVASGAFAAARVTVGVGHMCCGRCKSAATEGLSKVADNISIDGTNITMTLKEDNLVPALDALRKAGFPASKLEVSGPVTMSIAHLCCGGCKVGLTKSLAGPKVEGLDPDSIKVGEDSLTVQAKAGMKLDMVPLLAAIEKGGFSPSKITLTQASAQKRTVRRHVASIR